MVPIFLYLGQRFESTTFCNFQTTTKCCMISRRNSAMHSASMIVGKWLGFWNATLNSPSVAILLVSGRIQKKNLRKSYTFDCKPANTTATPHTKQSQLDWPIDGSESSPEFCEQKQYFSLVGNLMYLSVVSRPEICFAVYNLPQFVSIPGKTHWRALKHLQRFFKGTEFLSCL